MTLQKIGRYEIKSELGRGGMATVYKAYDPRFEREVALKVLPREMLHDTQFRVRFEREAKTIAALEHQAIVPVYDVGEEDGQPYFVMRYMTGGSLQDRIAKGPMSLADTAKIIDRLAPALDDAHLKGIIHRDLKPGNILFDRTGDPYISDFGIAKITQAQGGTVTGGAIIGTPAYMSPEQAQGDQVDGRSDIYAMGVILYEMLSGAQPFQATTPMAVVVKHITDPIPHILDANPSLPIAVEPIIEKAMAKSREQRFSYASEFSAALTAVARGESGEQAIKTASIHATQITAAKKTRTLAGKTQLAAKKSAEGGGASKTWIVIAIVTLLILLGVLGGGGFALYSMLSPTPTVAPTNTVAALIEPSATVSPTQAPTETPVPAQPTDTPTLPAATPTEAAIPAGPSIGGADEVAFVANYEIWAMNIDGSNLRKLTSDTLPKNNLQFIPGTYQVVYVSGTNINTLDTQTGQVDTIASFPFAKFLDTFRVSPDGKQVAISLNREMYIVPFDREKFKVARGKDALVAMKGCISATGSTQAAIHLDDLRWSAETKNVAWLFEGVSATGGPADLIRLVDISACDPARIKLLDEFPGTRFVPEGYGTNSQIPDFDWDGQTFFLFNTFDRNNGWGFLYTYNSEIHQGVQENPVTTSRAHCCYRDARWSPDHNYIFFAFQNKDKAGAPTQFYYIPVNALRTGVEFTPISMPDGFFKNPKEAPQPALHPVTP
jgi:hypothetical protein